jgi:hypothetical protein
MNQTKTQETKMDAWKSEIRDGMHIDWDMPIVMDDGLVLRADISDPSMKGKFPVILSYGPYGKGLAFQRAIKPLGKSWSVKTLMSCADQLTNTKTGKSLILRNGCQTNTYAFELIHAVQADRLGYMDHQRCT